ncbi:urease accessory protein UreF [Paenibacillus allorhizosphaerae]|uniref:Urease accessory protein UreF n=1 Tax=Paenibacillus allorhizosphaerae TaxID=2849866 RepID=A0ABN7U0A8_9BACL|nr:urease accessory protein UreF [Paenibacillus allorhizosphaerae]CAG7659113.1 Urease accessory protein UreF [Paenibacillus allorhizosphaerae]
MHNDTSFSWLAYTQLLDSALPIGGFSHSFGLETMVQSGRIERAEQLKHYIEAMLFHSWGPVDALAVKAVYRLAPDKRYAELWRIDREQHVQRVAAETRDGVAKMGRRLYQLTRAMYPNLEWEPLTGALQSKECIGTHPLIHGWVSHELQAPLAVAVEGYLYTCTMTCINSGLRLMSLGQTDGQRLLASLLPSIAEAAQQTESLDPLADGYGSVPYAEIAMMRHEGLYSRLFMS